MEVHNWYLYAFLVWNTASCFLFWVLFTFTLFLFFGLDLVFDGRVVKGGGRNGIGI